MKKHYNHIINTGDGAVVNNSDNSTVTITNYKNNDNNDTLKTLEKELEKLSVEIEKNFPDNKEELSTIKLSIEQLKDKKMDSFKNTINKFTIFLLNVAKELSLDILVKLITGEIKL